MSENDTKTDYGTWSNPPKQGMTRRGFIGAATKTVAAAVVLAQPGAKALADWAEGGRQVEDDNMPVDILSREELENTYRTRIHDLPETEFPSNYVELYFRSSVGETPLFRRLKDGVIVGFDVILVNHTSVDPDHFTHAQRDFMEKHSAIGAGLQRQIESVRESNREEIEENREAMRSEYEAKRSNLEGRRGNISNDRYVVELQALDYSYGRYLSAEVPEQDLREMAIRGYAPMSGTSTNDRGEEGPRSFLFLAVRDKEKTVTFASGDESITVSASRIPYRESNSVYAPSPDQSYPSEKNFNILQTPDEMGYVVVDGLTPGFILRHEMRHAQGVMDEESADKGALEGIVEAANHMAETGSDEKYWAVFRTPLGNTITRDIHGSTV